MDFGTRFAKKRGEESRDSTGNSIKNVSLFLSGRNFIFSYVPKNMIGEIFQCSYHRKTSLLIIDSQIDEHQILNCNCKITFRINNNFKFKLLTTLLMYFISLIFSVFNETGMHEILAKIPALRS